jgi:hypothetical protein
MRQEVAMVNRWSVALLLIGVIAGYVVSGTSVRAQGEPLPFAVGDPISLHYGEPPASNFVECSVAEIRGVYVRCSAPARVSLSQNVEVWHSLQSVSMVKKYR